MDVTGVSNTLPLAHILSHQPPTPTIIPPCHLIKSDESVAAEENEDRPIAMVILAAAIGAAVWSQACLQSRRATSQLYLETTPTAQCNNEAAKEGMDE